MKRTAIVFAAFWALTVRGAQAEQEHHHGMAMSGMLGPYAMTREASGTSWGPESTPHDGIHRMAGPWMLMLHGYVNAVYDAQGSPQGDHEGFSQSMLMGMAQRPLGPGTVGLRSMLSLDPTMGPAGYPLLLQTGETANGRDPLLDRQHPHDLFMELAATYSVPVGRDASVFVYGGLPGEPALGPSAFMHRFSGVENPEAPLSHHWLDSTHITYGVLTGGAVWRGLKVEGSGFRGREPDQHRWDIEPPRLDSWSTRLTVNPARDWSAQASFGRLHSPEQLEPDDDVDRLTASLTYNRPFDGGNAQTTAAWGQNRHETGHPEDAWLIETAVRFLERNTVFARFENIESHEVGRGRDATVSRASLGGVREVAAVHGIDIGVGAVGSVHFVPDFLEPLYGNTPLSGMLFVRAKIGAEN